MLDRLGEYGVGREVVSHYQKSLKESKQYLKSDYKVHLTSIMNIIIYSIQWNMPVRKRPLPQPRLDVLGGRLREVR